MRKTFLSSLAMAFALLGGCESRDVSSLKIINRSSNTLTKVVLKDARRVWVLGDIAPRAAVDFDGHLVGEGMGFVYWVENGRKYSAELCYYSGYFPAKGSVLIGEGRVRYDCRNEVAY